MQKRNKRARQIAVSRRRNLKFERVINRLEEQRAKFKADTRRALYELVETVAKVLEQFEQGPRMVNSLRKHEFFRDMHVVPKEAYKLVAQFALGAKTPGQREQANRYGRAIDHMRCAGEPVEGIAKRLASTGGIRAVLQDAKLKALGVTSELEEEPAPKQVTSHKSATTEAQWSGDDDPELEEEFFEEDEKEDSGSDGNGRRPARTITADDEEVRLEVTCLIAALRSILGACEVEMTVRIEQGADWNPVVLLSYRILK